jgi:hypothetical protein
LSESEYAKSEGVEDQRKLRLNAIIAIFGVAALIILLVVGTFVVRLTLPISAPPSPSATPPVDIQGHNDRHPASKKAAEPKPHAPVLASRAILYQTAPNGYVPTLLDPKRIDDSLTWNYWLDTERTVGAIPHPATGSLKLGVQNHLQFRLSTFDISRVFGQVAAIQSSPELLSAIETGVNDTTRSELVLDVLIHSVDEQQLQLAAESRHLSVRIDLESYRAALNDPKLRPRPGEAPIEDVLRKATIAEFSLDFIALMPGTHQVGIAIIDAASGFPLQSMIVSLGVDKHWPQSVSVDASRPTLFSSNSPPFDLALYLYELQSIVNGEPSSSLQAELRYRDRATGSPAFIKWNTDTSSLQALGQATATFQDTVGSVDSAADLLDAGYELGRLIFDPVPGISAMAPLGADKNNENAALAREVIVAAATYPPEQYPPSMLVQIIGGINTGAYQYSSKVLPIGALGVSTNGEKDAIFLGERFSLALMLTGQVVGVGGPCPSNWYVALPKLEDNSTGPLYDALEDLKPVVSTWPNQSQIHPQSKSLAELRGWLNGDAPDLVVGPYVFEYLGHHGAGRLFLDQGAKGVVAASMRRNFEGSSIAILNACNIAMDEVSDLTPIGRLAKLKVAATIATTSRISGHLAAAYMDCLSAVLGKRSDLTVGEAQAYTTQCLWSKEQGQVWGKHYEFGGAALKYILIGNPFQRMCAPIAKEPMK